MKREAYEKIGHPDQLMSYKEGVLTDGAGEGVRFVQVENGGNLSACIVPDRGMDLFQVRYKGKNMGYIAPCGIRSNHDYDGMDDHFLYNWFVGQLTTMGLGNIGTAKRAYGEMQGLHGCQNNTAAENYSYERHISEEGMALTVKGTMREGGIFKGSLKRTREIRFWEGKDEIVVRDTVTNTGFLPREFALLYHINFGYPLLDAGTRVLLDTKKVTPRTEEAARFADTWNRIEEPAVPYPERCYFHEVKSGRDGKSEYTIFNSRLGIGVRVTYPHDLLPYFCEWKMLGKGEYVLGMEPMNMPLDGPAPGEDGSQAPCLNAGESRTYEIVLDYVDHL